MLRIRIIAVAVAAAIASILSANGAQAQTASAGQSGQPPSLSQLLTQMTASPAQPPHSAATGRRHVRRVARRRHRSAAHHADQAGDPTRNRASVNDALGANAAPGDSAPASPTAPAADTDRAQQDDTFLPAAVVVGGQTVPIAAADQINAIDLAADNSPPMESTLPRGDGADAAPRDISAALQAAFDTQVPITREQSADAPQNAGAQETTTRAMSAQEISAEAVAQDTSGQDAGAENSAAVGSAAWIGQVLAALGGATAAGVLAWVLIGDGPARTYR